jgi:hypothetical protein
MATTETQTDLRALKPGDVLRFRIQPRVLLAGMTGICRIDSFEKSRRGTIVYIDTQQDDGSFFKRFARFAPFEIAFALPESDEFAVYEG